MGSRGLSSLDIGGGFLTSPFPFRHYCLNGGDHFATPAPNECSIIIWVQLAGDQAGDENRMISQFAPGCHLINETSIDPVKNRLFESNFTVVLPDETVDISVTTNYIGNDCIRKPKIVIDGLEQTSKTDMGFHHTHKHVTGYWYRQVNFPCSLDFAVLPNVKPEPSFTVVPHVIRPLSQHQQQGDDTAGEEGDDTLDRRNCH